MLAELAFLSVFVYQLWWYFIGRRKEYPPGPTPIPFLGNVLGVNFRYPERSFQGWAAAFGPVFTFWLGPMPLVVVTELGLLRKYGGDDFAGRADNFAVRFLVGGNRGVLNSQGALWREQRRFALHALRDLGFGRNAMEPKIHAMLGKLFHHIRDELAASEAGVISVSKPLEIAVGSVLCSVLMGKDYARDDPEFAEMRALNKELLEMFTGPKIFLLVCYPWLRHIPVPGRFGFSAMADFKPRFWSFFAQIVRDYKETFNPQAPVTDFTGAYLQEMHLRKKAGEDEGHFSESQLEVILADFALAGMDTSRATLEWAVLFMLHEQEVQAKVQQEVDIYFGGSPRLVGMADRAGLPYTAATLMEVQRLTNVLPINLQHSTTADVVVEGHRLPKGTPILQQISAVLADPKAFPEPQRFDPLRFLDENGNRLKKVDEWVPFGVGKRICGGESLARMQLFILFTELLRKYRILPAFPGKPMPSLVPQLKFTRTAKEFKCKLHLRH